MGEETRAHRIVREALRAELDRQEGGMESTVEASIAGQKLKVTGHDVNLIITCVSALGIVAVVVLLVGHQQDSRDASAAFVGAIKEQITAQREQTAVMREANCLQSYQGPPTEKSSFCKQVTR